MRHVKISYDGEGDLLEVQFVPGDKGRRTGVALTDEITLFCDTAYETLLGFSVVAYSKLLTLPGRPITELAGAPQEVQDKVRNLLKKDPLSQFFHLEDDRLRIQDVQLSELVSA